MDRGSSDPPPRRGRPGMRPIRGRASEIPMPRAIATNPTQVLSRTTDTSSPRVLTSQGSTPGVSSGPGTMGTAPAVLRRPPRPSGDVQTVQGRNSTPPISVASIQSRPHEQSGQGGPVAAAPVKAFTEPVKLLSDKFVFVGDAVQNMLMESSDFLVVGAIGGQGVGKSFIMSLLAGQGEGPFPVETDEQILCAEHATVGVDMYLTRNRMVLLDTQPLLSASILDRTMREAQSSAADGLSAELQMEIQAIQTVLFLLCVCHVVLVIQDHEPDLPLLRLLHTCEMLKPRIPLDADTSPLAPTPDDHFPDIVFIHNKVPRAMFTLPAITELQLITHTLMQYTRFKYRGGVNMGSSCLMQGAGKEGGTKALSDVNVYLLPHTTMPPPKMQKGMLLPDSPQALIHSLLRQVLMMPRRSFLSPMTEKEWLRHAGRVIEGIKKSVHVHEYNRTLTKIWHAKG